MKLHTHVFYEVEPGDCLSKIAERFGMGLVDILHLNPYLEENPDLIRSGQLVKIFEAKA